MHVCLKIKKLLHFSVFTNTSQSNSRLHKYLKENLHQYRQRRNKNKEDGKHFLLNIIEPAGVSCKITFFRYMQASH